MMKLQKDLLEHLPAFVYLLAQNYTISYANKHFREHFGDHQDKYCYQVIANRDKPCDDCMLSKVLETSETHQIEMDCSDNLTVQIMGTPYVGEDGTLQVLALGVDISGRRMNELLLQRSHDELEIRVKRRTEDLYNLNLGLRCEIENHKKTSQQLKFQQEMSSAFASLKKALLNPNSFQEIPNLILKKAIYLTGSELGIAGYIKPETDQLVNATMAEDTWCNCEIESKKSTSDIFKEQWSWVLRHRKPLLSNYDRNHGLDDMPTVHPQIRRLLCVPALFNGQPVGVITLANAKQDYASGDLEAVERLANIYALALHRKLEENKLLWTNQHLNALLEASPLPIMVVNRFGKATFWNQMARKTFGWSQKEVQELGFPMFSGSEAQRFNLMHEDVLNGIDVGTTEIRAKSRNHFYMDVVIFSAPVMSVDEPDKICCGIYIMDDITADKQMETDLRISERQLRELSAQLLHALEKERKRIALELHDRIGQSLTAIKFSMESALVQNESQKQKTLQSGINMLRNSIDEVRKISMDLRPSMLDDLGLLATANWFCREFSQTFPNIRITKRFFVKQKQVPEPLKIVIYRVMQEAFNNIAKHSNATKAILILKKNQKSLELKIEDNGQGIALKKNMPPPHSAGLGLASMREQTEISGGHFEIISALDKGTIIRCTWFL
ncbi:hypothetical protein JCM31598_39430 [Desulfonatronum parangueonense]